MKLIRIPLVSLLGLVAACSGSPSGEKLDIGDRKTSVSGEKLTDYSGNWDGYAEAYQFGSGSDRVRVVLDGAGNGTIEFGDMPSLGTPTDPHVAFPPVDWDLEQPGQVWLPPDTMTLREGFKYTVTGASLAARRFRFNVAQGEIVADWCALQTPNPTPFSQLYPDHPDLDRSCMPPAFDSQMGMGSNRNRRAQCSIPDVSGSGSVSVDCGWIARCEALNCICDSTSCGPDPNFGNATIDSALENEGNDLVGTLVFKATGPVGEATMNRVNVRLTRQP